MYSFFHTASSPNETLGHWEWMDPVITECIYAGLRAESIMRIINTFIMARNLSDDFIGTTSIWKRINSILLAMESDTKGLLLLGMDGRRDKTLVRKNRLKWEEVNKVNIF